jgi:hypothetical protein
MRKPFDDVIAHQPAVKTIYLAECGVAAFDEWYHDDSSVTAPGHTLFHEI